MFKERPHTLGELRGNANKCEGKAPAVIIQRGSKHIKANVQCVCVCVCEEGKCAVCMRRCRSSDGNVCRGSN